MTYQGSKDRYKDKILPILKQLRKPGQLYWEPFLGSGSIFCHMPNPRFGSDNLTSLIMLWHAVIEDTFIEPSSISKEHYDNLMKDPRPSALQAYAGLFWSFSGMYNKGHSPDHFHKSRSFHKMRMRAKMLNGAVIKAADYREPGIRDAIIYCDPPYQGTTAYNGVEAFNHIEFVRWCFLKQQAGNTVVISEYWMPPALFQEIAEFPANTSLGVSKREKSKPEKLFIPIPGAMVVTTITENLPAKLLEETKK